MYLAELNAHYRDVRQRIINAVPLPPKTPPLIIHRPVPEREAPVLMTPRHVMVEKLKAILAQYDVTWEDAFSYSKRARYILPKWHVWHEMANLGWSYNQIAKFCRPMDPYNHSSVSHGVRQYRLLIGVK